MRYIVVWTANCLPQLYPIHPCPRDTGTRRWRGKSCQLKKGTTCLSRSAK